MPHEIKIPAVGESITEVQISQWLKAEGDSVKQDEPVAVIDSKKTTFELPAPKSGKLTKIVHQAGETVSIGTVIAQMELDGDAAPAQPAQKESPPKSKPEANQPGTPEKETTKEQLAETPAPEKKSAKDEAPKPETSDTKVSETTETEELKKESPPAAKTETAPPPGKPTPPPPPPTATSKTLPDHEEEVVPMTMLRRTVARRLVDAQQTMAMLTTFNEVDMSAIQALRKEHQEAFSQRYQVKLGLMSFFVKAVIDALKQVPQLNAAIRENDLVYRNYFNLGVAIASERGLVVPVIRRAERLSFSELEKTIADFAQRAKEGKLKPDELEGGTFTITNGGVFGSLLSTPIINPPQAGILGMHTIQERPVAVAGQVVIRPMMYVALTYDHRIVDGRESVLFLRRVKEAIENPARMLIEI